MARVEDVARLEDVARVEDAARAEDAARLEDVARVEDVARLEDVARVEDAARAEDAARLEDVARVEDVARLEDVARVEDAAEWDVASTALAGGTIGQAELRRTTVAELLAEARRGLRRFGPDELAAAMEAGPDELPLVIDIRDRDDRERTGMIPGSVSIPLLVLEWRCDPTSGHSHPAVRSLDQLVVTVCNEGYTSSFAAASLKRLGFGRAADLEGGVEGWGAAGLPLVQTPPPT